MKWSQFAVGKISIRPGTRMFSVRRSRLFPALKAFLQETSIHGLRYLTESSSLVARIVWFILILSSFSMAGWIIYANVLNWHISPAVVTSVDTFRVEVQFNA